MINVNCEKASKNSPIFLNKNVAVPSYDFETYKSCGLKIDLNFALDLTISNGNFKKDERSLHPETYSKIMQEYGQMFENLTPRNHTISTFGFGAKQLKLNPMDGELYEE